MTATSDRPGPTATDVRLANLLGLWADQDGVPSTREQAFADLVAELTPRIFAVCHRELGNPSDAEEATQDTFAKIARSADSFRGDAKVSTWVYRIAVNACRDLQRKLGRRPQVPVEDIEQVAQQRVGGDDHVADVATGFEQMDALGRAMAQLDELSATLLILCAVEGLTYPEASEVLDLPVGTIKSRVHRARARLADLLAEDDRAHAPAASTRPGEEQADTVGARGKGGVGDDDVDDDGPRT